MNTEWTRLARILLVLGLILVLAAVACSPPPTPTPLPTPTHTPPPPTATPLPADTPAPVIEVGDKEWLRGEAWTAYQEGQRLASAGDHEAAIESFRQALRHHGKPSGVLENRIALAYGDMGMYDRAAEHYTNAIAIGDSPADWISRAVAYTHTGQCDLAVDDAKIVLDMEPESGPGFHTKVEANVVLYSCYFYGNDMDAALRHVDAALALAEEHSYPANEVAEIAAARAEILNN